MVTRTDQHYTWLAQRAVVLLLIGLQLTVGMIMTKPVIARAPVTYYVDARNGNDRNNGTSPGAAWRTITQANALLQPGDTVIIYSGTYRESVAPLVSGTADARITYRAAEGHHVYIEGGPEYLLYLWDRSYITIEGMTFQNPTGGWGEIRRGNYNEIIGNTFTANGKTPNYAGLYLYDHSTYNKILNNEFRNWGVRDEIQEGDAIRLSRQADYTLIEGNRFINAGHSLLGIDTSYNVVRNNYFENAWHKGIDMVWRVNPPWAPDEEFVARRNVIEKNTFARCKMGITREKGGAGIQIGSAETIFRNNLLVENERMGVIVNGWADAPKPYGNRLYHNTFVNNGTASDTNQSSAILITQWGQSQVDITNNVIKNNIICKEGAREHQVFFYIFPDYIYGAQYYKDSFMVAGNIINTEPLVEFTGLEGSKPITYYQQKYGQFIQNNTVAEPRFVNPAAGQYQLAPGSTGIDAAVPLTQTTSGGLGTVVKVEDASYFTDGYGLVPGDQVKIGSSAAVSVVKVDLDRNTLTLARPMLWGRNAPVYLGEFSGAAPDIGAFESDGAPPPPTSALSVVSPNGGEEWTVGQTAVIRWNSVNVNSTVKIELSRNGGGSFETLASGVANDGEQAWVVNGAPTSNALIRITSTDSQAITDVSNAVFKINASVPPPPLAAITVMSPNGGEQWTTGDIVNIRWNSVNLSGPVKIELSRDGGATFELLFASTDNDGLQEWVVNGAATSRAIMRVASVNAVAVDDSSDTMFSINTPTPPAPPTITIVSPNGGEVLKLGQEQTIRWTSTNITGNVTVRFSRNGGRTFDAIAENVPNTGEIQWTPTGLLGSSKCLIEIISVEDSTVSDQSDDMFTIRR